MTPMERMIAAQPERFPTTPLHAAGTPLLRVLAYGDSMTAGYCESGDRFEPYGKRLSELLAPELHVEIVSCGLSGWTAEQMAEGSHSKSLDQVLAETGTYDLVLLMAGTNDLAPLDCNSERIAATLRMLHQTCHRSGSPRTVALAVPPAKGHAHDEEWREQWLQTNAALGEWARGVGASEGVALFVETADLVPYNADSLRFWDSDGLHFSPEGSRWLAEKLAPLIKPLLSVQTAPAAPRAPGSSVGDCSEHGKGKGEGKGTSRGTFLERRGCSLL